MNLEPERLLRELSDEVVRAVREKIGDADAAGEIVAVRSRDITLGLDDAAETAMEEGLASRGLCCRLISEERGDRVICEGEPGFTIVFDPVDGSANAIRGLDLWVTAMAYSPATENVHFGDFTHASVRLSTGEHYHASRGGGAFLNKDEIHTAGKQFPGKPMFSVYLSGSKDLPPGLGSFLKKAKIRALGSIALDICLVAAGHFDGIADVRNLISSWDVIAASLVLDEAGGVLTDCDGNPVNWGAGERDLSIVAARNEELHSMLHSIL